MKVLFTSFFALFLATSAWATGELSAPATCDVTDLGVSSGTLNVDLVWEANRINTSWYTGYGDNTQITGNGVPTSCNYDSAISLPAALSRPGYNFAGWTLKPPCLIPSTLASTNGNAYASKRLSNGEEVTSGGATASTYGLTESGQWGVSWTNGDKVVGEAICSQTSGTANVSGTPDVSGTGTTRYCWCRTTGYQANGENKCNLVSSSWVLYKDYLGDMFCSQLSGSNGCRRWEVDAGACAYDCAQSCASYVSGQSVFRTAVFGTNVQPQCEIPSSLAGTNGSSVGYKNDSTGTNGADSSNTSDYGLTEDNTWGVTWSNGDKVVGEALCSAKNGDNHSWAWGGNSADWTSTEIDLTTATGDARRCWCKATGYIANGESQCSLSSSSSWAFDLDYGSDVSCAYYCAGDCAGRIRYNSGFRAAVFTGLVAE